MFYFYWWLYRESNLESCTNKKLFNIKFTYIDLFQQRILFSTMMYYALCKHQTATDSRVNISKVHAEAFNFVVLTENCCFQSFRIDVSCRVSTAWIESKYGHFSGPYFPVFGLNTEIYSVNLRIQSECRKIRTKKKLRIWTHFTYKKLKNRSI